MKNKILSRLRIDKKKLLWSLPIFAAVTIWLGFYLFGGISGGIRVVYSLDKRQNDREIINLIDSAQKYVYFAVYYFTKEDIAEALIRAKRRGLEVSGITDREGATEAANAKIFKLLDSAGISIETQKHLDGIMHIKALVTDKAYASGSYNWTQSATDANDEVLEIGFDDKVRREYLGIIKKVITQNGGSLNSVGKINIIDYTEAPKHIGEYAKVSGVITKVSKSAASDTVFFDFCKSKNKCPFSAVTFASDAKKLGDIKAYEGKVTVEGVIRSYKGSAEIVIEDPKQIDMLK